MRGRGIWPTAALRPRRAPLGRPGPAAFRGAKLLLALNFGLVRPVRLPSDLSQPSLKIGLNLCAKQKD